MTRSTFRRSALAFGLAAVALVCAAPSTVKAAGARMSLGSEPEAALLTHTYVILLTARNSPNGETEEQLRQTAEIYARYLSARIPRSGYAVVAVYESEAQAYCDGVRTDTCDLLKVEQAASPNRARTEFTFAVRSQRFRPPAVVRHDTVGEAPCVRPVRESSRTVWDQCWVDVLPRFGRIFTAYEPGRHWIVRRP